MIVKIKSNLSERINEMDLPLTQEQLEAIQNREEPIQSVCKKLGVELSVSQREFLITGMDELEQDYLYGKS